MEQRSASSHYVSVHGRSSLPGGGEGLDIRTSTFKTLAALLKNKPEPLQRVKGDACLGRLYP